VFDYSTHSVDRSLGVLVFPNTHYTPASAYKGLIRQAIPLNVPPKLGAPVPLVSRGRTAMFWTYVPEAAVDKHGDLAPCKDNVGPHSDPRRQVEPVILAIPIAQPVQLAT
jgi:hypothetical protein